MFAVILTPYRYIKCRFFSSQLNHKSECVYAEMRNSRMDNIYIQHLCIKEYACGYLWVFVYALIIDTKSGNTFILILISNNKPQASIHCPHKFLNWIKLESRDFWIDYRKPLGKFIYIRSTLSSNWKVEVVQTCFFAPQSGFLDYEFAI